jgi:hypothetical protein
MKRALRFIALCWIQRSIARALWVDSYENAEQENGK